MPVAPQIIKLPRISENKIRKMYYIPEVKEHVAKMQIALTNWILKKYAGDGYVILDPMCGVGTTIIEAMRMYPYVTLFGYELEEKFVKMAIDSIEKTIQVHKGDLFKKELPSFKVTQGDARCMKGGDNFVDLIVTSPPYGGQVKGGENYKKRKERLIKAGYVDHPMVKEGYKGLGQVDWQYSDNPDNIGNLKYGDPEFLAEKSYIGDMYKVYQECYRVLDSRGLLVLVTKNSVKDGKQMRLDLDTIKLCEIAGFKFIEHHLRVIKDHSLWRNLYKQQWVKDHPSEECPIPKYEDVLVFNKAREGSGHHGGGGGLFGRYTGVHFLPGEEVLRQTAPEPARVDPATLDHEPLTTETIRSTVRSMREQEAMQRSLYEREMARMQEIREMPRHPSGRLSSAVAHHYIHSPRPGGVIPIPIEIDQLAGNEADSGVTWTSTSVYVPSSLTGGS